ncbi:MAG: EamA family transporter [Betaproteobacteria bacterium HGW-Betaproteobacteria-22]|nr:MAG: EamA family transporter [Betaproteobacteria bacterium HGW-Betaproteobacteria-22]
MYNSLHKHKRLIWLTLLALTAFAANSLLCRLALANASIDAASFSMIRLFSGAISLWLIVTIAQKDTRPTHAGNWLSAIFLFLYVTGFSFAYIHLNTGVGALILFGAVQVSMLLKAITSGERPSVSEWLGLLIALAGLTYLVMPGMSAPPLLASLLMSGAGVAWGLYSLQGRNSSAPLVATAGNFMRATPLAMLVLLLSFQHIHLTSEGVILAIASGSIASGVGYAVWYTALRELTATRAATVQLAVPILAAIAGTLFLAEPITLRLAIASVMILGGIAIAVMHKKNT